MVKDMLIVRNLYLLIMGKTNLEKAIDDDWGVLHLKVVTTIRQWVDVSIFHHIFEEVMTGKLWKKLETMYEKSTFMNKGTIIRSMYMEGV